MLRLRSMPSIAARLFALAFLAAGFPSASLGGPPDELLGLAPLWTRPLGSGYSRAAAADGSVLTLFADGEVDCVVALDAEDGSPRWRHALGPTYLGHDGSLDGPISTPVIGAGSVFALGPRGRLVALDLASGELRWSVDLVLDLGAEPPEYGFTTTPVLAGELLVVQAGGSEGRNLVAFDAATGELRWALGEGAAAYQSPAVLELAGRRQLVVLSGRELLGVDPRTGEPLWTHALGERDSAASGSAGAIDDARFFLYVSGRLAVFELSASDEGFAVEERYRTRELGDTYAQPVHHDGHLYGFKSTFLTCVDAATGERVWRSRPPGGRGLVLVGDRLVVFGSDGEVVVVRATPEGYLEESRVRALEHSSYTWPSLERSASPGRVFVRNSEQLACLGVVPKGPEAVADAATALPPDAGGEHAFGAFLREVEAAADPAPLVAAFLAEQESFPILEGDLVHFVFSGSAEDVAIVGAMTGGERAEPMLRIAGTDLYHRTYRIEPGLRWDYNFQIDYQRLITDPRNPLTAPGRWAPKSEVLTPSYERAAHLDEPRGPRGRLESHEFESEQLGNTRAIQVYLPAGYDDGDERYPVLFVHDGPEWLEKGAMASSLDNLIGERVRPLVAVFIAPLGQWWFEAGGSRTEEYVEMLATELLPWLEERYRLAPDPADRALAGVRGFGLTAALGAVARPDVFGKAAAQSVSLGDVARHAFFELLAERPPADALFYVDWNRYEARDPDGGYDFGADGPLLAEALAAAGCSVVGGEALDCHGWGSWRARTDDVLVALFPAR